MSDSQDYFATLTAALREAGIAEPAMIIDIAKLAANVAAVTKIVGHKKHIRVVVKSIPCAELIKHVTAGLHTHRYMVFNRAMLHETYALDSQADILMGKPLPVAAAAAYYQEANPDHPAPQWLIDTEERLHQYAALADERNLTLRVNFEVDVGLHRGGFENPDDLAQALTQISPRLRASGLMGYDPQIAKFPVALQPRLLQDSKRTYAAMQEIVQRSIATQQNPETPTYNTAGSPTFHLHTDNNLVTELAIGSAFVKPTDFDRDSLTTLSPAAFIATPVLKAIENNAKLGSDLLPSLLRGRARASVKNLFIHGGNWQASPVYPPDVKINKIYGHSSNQEAYIAPEYSDIKPDDWLFFRPHQSEAILLQFGPLLAFDGQKIVAQWPSFGVST